MGYITLMKSPRICLPSLCRNMFYNRRSVYGRNPFKMGKIRNALLTVKDAPHVGKWLVLPTSA